MRFDSAALILLVLAACGRRESAVADSYQARDSAGIQIFDNTAPQWGPNDGWRVTAEPHVDIGVEGAPGHDLDDVVGVMRLADGRIAVGSGGHREIRFFDQHGKHTASVGRHGEGPGEFSDLSHLFLLPGDSLLAVDGRLRRLTVFDASGKLIRTARMRDPAGASVTTPFLLLPDGTLLARPGFTFSSNTEPGVRRDSALLVRYDLNGAFVDSVARFPIGELFVFRDNSSGNALSGELPLGKRTHYAAARDGFFVGSGASFGIEQRNINGALRSIVRANRPNRPVTADDIARLKQPDEGVSPDLNAFWLRVLNGIQLPTEFPAYAGLATDRDGFLWVKEYAYPPDAAPSQWEIFDAEGRWLGGLELPPRFRIMQIRADELIGVWTDEVDVEHVRAYRLDRKATR